MIVNERNQYGFALLVVLWTVALLALLGTWLVVEARDRMAIARDQSTAAELEAAADGATQHAVFELLSGQWTADGSVRMLRIGPDIVSIYLEDEALKLNPNAATAAEIQALLQLVGVDLHQAATLAVAIVAWRTPDQANQSPGVPFVRLDDLAAVPGMTPEILQLLRPHLTLFTGSDPDLIAASNGAANAVHVTGILAVARGSGKAMFARHIVVRTNARRTGRRYEVLMSERESAGAVANLVAQGFSVRP